jgi:phosphoglycolate phosphatase
VIDASVNIAGSLVLFDIDGTLMRNAGLHHKEALVEGIRRVIGISTTLNGIATSGMLDRDLIKGMLLAQGVSARRIRQAMAGIVAECQAAYLANCAADLRACVCRGIPELTTNLHRAGATLGLVTGNLTQIGWKKVELAGLREYFSVGAFAEDGKTRTRLARVAAQRARKAGLVSKDSHVSLIGDHSNDVAAAKANGFQAIAVASGLVSYEELEALQPDVLVRDATELALKHFGR